MSKKQSNKISSKYDKKLIEDFYYNKEFFEKIMEKDIKDIYSLFDKKIPKYLINARIKLFNSINLQDKDEASE